MTFMRTITSHEVSGSALNEHLVLGADEDSVTAGGASSLYRAKWGTGPHDHCEIQFQTKPIKSAKDIDGVSNEVLLAIVADRLEGFQKGPFSNRENACALTKIQEAMHWLHSRTRDRVQRGVEGKLEK